MKPRQDALVRRRMLPQGWYPLQSKEILAQIQEWKTGLSDPLVAADAGILPHAGWFFSGSIAFRVLSAIRKDIDTLVIAGGHLSEQSSVLAAEEKRFETPLGLIESDNQLLYYLSKQIPLEYDGVCDNTVEVHLPLMKHLFPNVRLLWLRVPPSALAKKTGEVLQKASQDLGKSIAVVGSTDLTHYGPSYGFFPAGKGTQALRWMEEINDKAIIDAFLRLDAEAALREALENHSACSAGAAVCALSFASCLGITQGRLLEYSTSAQKHAADSFVGYAGVFYTKENP